LNSPTVSLDQNDIPHCPPTVPSARFRQTPPHFPPSTWLSPDHFRHTRLSRPFCTLPPYLRLHLSETKGHLDRLSGTGQIKLGIGSPEDGQCIFPLKRDHQLIVRAWYCPLLARALYMSRLALYRSPSPRRVHLVYTTNKMNPHYVRRLTPFPEPSHLTRSSSWMDSLTCSPLGSLQPRSFVSSGLLRRPHHP